MYSSSYCSRGNYRNWTFRKTSYVKQLQRIFSTMDCEKSKNMVELTISISKTFYCNAVLQVNILYNRCLISHIIIILYIAMCSVNYFCFLPDTHKIVYFTSIYVVISGFYNSNTSFWFFQFFRFICLSWRWL